MIGITQHFPHSLYLVAIVGTPVPGRNKAQNAAIVFSQSKQAIRYTKQLLPNYGVFDFVNLFSEAIHEKRFRELNRNEQKALVARFEHKVSDHMPIWFRIPLPGVQSGSEFQAPT